MAHTELDLRERRAIEDMLNAKLSATSCPQLHSLQFPTMLKNDYMLHICRQVHQGDGSIRTTVRHLEPISGGSPMSDVQHTRVEVGQNIFGYRKGHKQHQCALRIHTKHPSAFYEEDAVAFLKVALETSLSGGIAFLEKPSSQIERSLKGVVSTANAIAQHALERGSFPSFDKAVVTHLATHPADTHHVALTLLVPTERHLDHQIIKSAYSLGLKIALAFTQPSDARTDLNTLVNDLLDRLVTATANLSHGGFSSRFILREAFDRGFPILHRSSGHYQIGQGCKQRVFHRSATFQDSSIGSQLTFDKWTCIQHLKLAGIPVPRSHRVKDVEEAKVVADQLGFPVVVKPSNRDRGEGVTVDIGTTNELTNAYEAAAKLSKRVLVENRVPGICHRLLIFRDQLVFAYARHPVSVVGDGTSSIASLAEEAQRVEGQKAKHLRKKTASLTSDTLAVLSAQSYGMETILDEDQIAYLRPYQSLEWGGFDQALTEKIHPENIELACRATRLFGLEIAGIDLISQDVSQPWYENGAVINEVNFRPQVGENTARAVLDICFPKNNADIPIKCFIGDASAMTAALKEHKRLCAEPSNAFLTSHVMTISPNHTEIKLDGLDGLFERSEYLLKEPRADALIIVVQTDELLHTGLPFPRASSMQLTSRTLLARQSQNTTDDEQVMLQLRDLIENALQERIETSVV